MSTLLLVRHGQTRSFFTDGYTQLTSLGQAQAARLRAWADAGEVVPDHVFVGPQVRHAQTHAGAALPGWPDPVMLSTLDEHTGMAVMAHVAATGEGPSDVVAAVRQAMGGDRAALMPAFVGVLRAWTQGEVVGDRGQTWGDFRDQVAAALDVMTGVGRGKTVWAFTSGGVVGAAVASVLGVSDEAVALDLAMSVRNTALTTVKFRGGARALDAFNHVPHLAGTDLASAI